MAWNIGKSATIGGAIIAFCGSQDMPPHRLWTLKKGGHMIRKGTILVVDDTHANLKLLTDVLAAEGYQVHPADSGKIALASVKAMPPELILLDIRMPGMDGFEILRRLKAQEESRDVPVIFLSAVTEVEQRVEGLKLGAVDFISMPFQREELLTRVQTHLDLFQLRARLTRQAADLLRANEQLRSEIDERKRHEEKLEYFALHDALTGLLNRRSLEEMLNRTIARAKRGVVSSLLYMDLDNFKEVNDTVGHAAGDEVLNTLSDLLKAELRTEDVIFRLGGDEFAVLLEGMDSRESLPAAERLREVVEAHPFEPEGRVFRLSLSIGMIEIDGTLATGGLLSHADTAMYRAKERGKNRVVQALVEG
jgi:diguanylate cyclase (GGDEF)-like protein